MGRFGTIAATALLAAATLAGHVTAASLDHFTYQGRLLLDGSPATNVDDLRITFFDAEIGGNQLWLTQSPIVVDEDGLFTVTLWAFDSLVNGDDLWMEITIFDNGVPETLAPRQPVTSAFRSMYSRNTRNITALDGGGIEVDGVITSNAGSVRSRNPNDNAAQVMLDWLDDIARLRIGGSGIGSDNGLDIQTQQDVSLMRLLGNGDVGIGTTSPSNRLTVRDGNHQVAIVDSTNGKTWTLSTVNDNDLGFYEDGSTQRMLIQAGSGNVGIGNTSPQSRLDVLATQPSGAFEIGSAASFVYDGVETIDPVVRIESHAGSNSQAALSVSQMAAGSLRRAALFMAENDNTAVVAVAQGGGAGVEARSFSGVPLLADHMAAGSGDIAIFQYQGFSEARIDSTGRGYFNGGTQTGGADVAEAFEVEGERSEYESGDVLVISRERDRTVTLSREPYSTLVAGVHATKPGVLLTNRSIDDLLGDTVPMGVVGVIPTKVTSENGPIHRGDLLVTSSTAGHAMKGTQRDRMVGAIIGKALQNFDGSGTGVIEVMVNVK